MRDKIYTYFLKTQSISELLHERREVELHVTTLYIIMFVISANETKVSAKVILFNFICQCTGCLTHIIPTLSFLLKIVMKDRFSVQ